MITVSGRSAPLHRVPFTRCSLFFTPRTQASGDFSDPFAAPQSEPVPPEEIPQKPTFSAEARVYKDVVRPEDVCNLFLRPCFTDVAVSTLAKDCPVSGRDEYRVVSKSSISDSKLMFAFMVTEWMDAVAAANVELQPLSNSNEMFRYTESKRQETLANIYTEDVWDTRLILATDLTGRKKQVTALDKFITRAAQEGISLENASTFLLSKAGSDDDFVYLFNHIQAESLQLIFLSLFTSKTVEIVNATPTPARLQAFSQYFRNNVEHYEALFAAASQASSGIAVFLDLEPRILDTLVQLTSKAATSIAEMAIPKQALRILIDVKGFAPLKETFADFLVAYFNQAQIEKLTNQQILRELAELKQAFLTLELSKEAFTFVLNELISCTYDLSHFLKVMGQTSSNVLAHEAESIFARLKQLQKQEAAGGIIAQVQIAQLGRLLVENGAKEEDCRKLIERYEQI